MLPSSYSLRRLYSEWSETRNHPRAWATRRRSPRKQRRQRARPPTRSWPRVSGSSQSSQWVGPDIAETVPQSSGSRNSGEERVGPAAVGGDGGVDLGDDPRGDGEGGEEPAVVEQVGGVERAAEAVAEPALADAGAADMGVPQLG